MKMFLGMLFYVTQATNNGGIVHAFDVCIYGLFPDPDLGKFGLKHWRFKQLFSYWTYSTIEDGDNEDQAYPYWETYQMVK